MIEEAAKAALKVVSHNPWAMGAVGVGALVIAAPAFVAGPALAAAGFTANGVAAGSAAATVQSTIGSVGAGSLFATLQSAGAGGYGIAVVSGAVKGIGGSIMAAGGLKSWPTK